MALRWTVKGAGLDYASFLRHFEVIHGTGDVGSLIV
jgi:hypothetical protein